MSYADWDLAFLLLYPRHTLHTFVRVRCCSSTAVLRVFRATATVVGYVAASDVLAESFDKPLLLTPTHMSSTATTKNRLCKGDRNVGVVA